MFLVKQQTRLNYLNHTVLVEDASTVSLSSGATGTNHTFASLGIPGKRVLLPCRLVQICQSTMVFKG